MNTVERIGSTVHRPTGAWTPTIHALLHHLREVGFARAPEPLGFDADGREVLSFVNGEVGDGDLSDSMRSDTAVVSVARLLRALHDASASFISPPDAVWQLPPRT